MHRLFPLILACLLAWGSAPAWSAEAETGAAEVEAEGSYLMGDNDSRRSAREMALVEAKRACLEKAGTYLVSRTDVENFELKKDEIFSRAAARIQAEVIDEKWEHVGDTLRVTLRVKATVRPEDFVLESEDEDKAVAKESGRAGQAAGTGSGGAGQVPAGQTYPSRPTGPENPAKMLDLFYARLDRNEYPEALQVANRIVKRYPRLGEGYYARALLYKRIGREGLRLADLRRACGLNHQAACRLLSEQLNRQGTPRSPHPAQQPTAERPRRDQPPQVRPAQPYGSGDRRPQPYQGP